MPRCVNCGTDVVPVRQKLNPGCVIVGCLLVGIGVIIYMVYHLSKPADRCPVCGKNAYTREGTASQAVYCTKCGKPLASKATSCASCGTKVG